MPPGPTNNIIRPRSLHIYTNTCCMNEHFICLRNVLHASNYHYHVHFTQVLYIENTCICIDTSYDTTIPP